jgi:PPM family protein phosphatase
MKVKYFGLSDIGRVRQRNEDAWGASLERLLFVLADGMGGHPAGDVAAQAAVDAVMECDDLAAMREALLHANARVFERSREGSELEGMGTTVCALHLTEDRAILGHVGDSRIYRREGERMVQLTEDHSLVSRMIERGELSPEEAARSGLGSVITQALGTRNGVDPSVQEVELGERELFLLCTDGLSDVVEPPLLEGSLEEQAQRYLELALEAGSTDNITLVLVEVER